MEKLKSKLKTGLRVERKAIISLCFSFFGLLAFLPFQNCAQESLEFTQLETKISYAYAYGESSSDQDLLQKKMKGYERPSLKDIFNQWSRIAGSFSYQKASNIIPENNYSFCFTTLDADGNWTPGVHPETGAVIQTPGSYSGCIGSQSFAAASWSYINASNSLRCATNAHNFAGFVSGVPFDSYENEAIVTSEGQDDDAISLIIASVTDAKSNVHVLAATRTQGGTAPMNGWGFNYYLNGTLISTIHNVSVGGVYKNPVSGSRTPLTDGWNGRHSLIKVIRQKEKIYAFASVWGTANQALQLDPNSQIEIDLADPIHQGKLDIFKGPQKYGYGSQSQLGSTFKNINFKSLEAKADYLFDLKNNRVYKKIEDGSDRYESVSNSSVTKQLGSNLYIINPETQRAFFLWSGGRYKEVEGDSLDKPPISSEF